jgi:uncharacterized protein YjbI with pentapeptide repeats
LAQTNLRQAYLRGARLEGASLRGANLEDARLPDARLEEAWLQGACLRRATFNDNTKLEKTVFNDACLDLDDLGKQKDFVHESAKEDLFALITRDAFGPAELTEADLRGLDLSKTVGLTQN